MIGVSVGVICFFSLGYGGEVGCVVVGGFGSFWRFFSIWLGFSGLEGSMGGVVVFGLVFRYGFRVVFVGRSRKEKGRKRLLVFLVIC